MMIYGQRIDVISIDPTTSLATCQFSMAEVDGRSIDLASFMTTLSATERKKFEKELANNPAMAASRSKAKYGGYGGKQERTVPVTDILTGEEKAELRNLKRRARKGHVAELMAYYDGATNLPEALAKFYKRIVGTSRLRRVNGVDAAGCLQLELVVKK